MQYMDQMYTYIFRVTSFENGGSIYMNLQFILPRQLIAKIEEWMCDITGALSHFPSAGVRCLRTYCRMSCFGPGLGEPYASNPHTEISALKEQL